MLGYFGIISYPYTDHHSSKTALSLPTECGFCRCFILMCGKGAFSVTLAEWNIRNVHQTLFPCWNWVHVDHVFRSKKRPTSWSEARSEAIGRSSRKLWREMVTMVSSKLVSSCQGGWTIVLWHEQTNTKIKQFRYPTPTWHSSFKG